MGILAPNGTGLKQFWRSLAAGESGIGPITLFDPAAFRNRIAGEVKEFDPLDYMPADWKPQRMARHTQLAFAATQMALKNADFDPAARKRGGEPEAKYAGHQLARGPGRRRSRGACPVDGSLRSERRTGHEQE